MPGIPPIVILLATMALAGAGRQARAPFARAEPTLEVSPTDALMDARLAIRVTSLAPGDTVVFTASTSDARGVRWSARAAFVAPAGGIVDLGALAPVSGTWAGVDAMGLLWSMRPATGTDAFDPPPGLAPMRVTVEAEVHGRSLAQVVVLRRAVAAGVRRIAVHEGMLVGTLFLPAVGGPWPGVVVLGGSEGGTDERTAALLASHGVAAFALAYFGVPPLQRSLVRVPLERVRRGLEWLGSQRDVDSARLALFGTSRGGELALLAAAHFAEVRAVVGIVPSAIVEAGLEFGRGPVPESPWTYRGRPVPYMRFVDWTRFAANGSGWGRIAPAVIPVERIRGPVVLVSGDQDELGFSTPLSRVGVDRLCRSRHPYADLWLHYSEAGHLIGAPYLPMANRSSLSTPYGLLHFGGTPAGNARAEAESWPQVLRVLEFQPGAVGLNRASTLCGAASSAR